jgi:transitional endoplasmic reticulum ATPase
VEALARVAPPLGECGERAGVLHALGDHRQAEVGGQVDGRPDDHGVGRVVRGTRDEDPVDLDLVDRQPLETGRACAPATDSVGPVTSRMTAPPPTLRLRVQLSGSQLDARRGVVRVSGATMAALGLSAWDTVSLTPAAGTGGPTAALVAAAPPGTHPFVLLADRLTLANLGLPEGADVDVGPLAVPECRRVLVAPPEQVRYLADRLAADTVRLALLGKVLRPGDRVALVPQDFSLPPSVAPVSLGRAAVELRTVLGPDWQGLTLTVTDAEPVGPSRVTMATVVAVEGGSATGTSATPVPSPPERAGGTASSRVPAAPPAPPPPGLDEPLRDLTEWLDLDFHHRELLERLGSGRRLGVLVTGAAGSGKVSVVRAAAAAVGAGVVHVWGPELAGLTADAALSRLAGAADRAAAAEPSVLLVEDVDAVVPVDAAQVGPALLAELRRRVADGRLAVVCTTSRPEACDPRLREPGLLEREVAIPLLTRLQRREVLGRLTEPLPLGAEVDLDDAAGRTPGFVLADLVSLVHEAGVRAAHRHREAGRTEAAGESAGAPPTLVAADLEAALGVVRPSTAEDRALEAPDLSLDDVGDMEKVKAALTEAALWPLSHPDTFARLGVDPPRGVLLYGPPGCGKTFLVRALAGTGQLTVFPVKGAEVMTKWVGESERGLREVFRRARRSAPAMVFLDEIDALAPRRGQSTDSGVSDRLVATLLTELDGIERLTDVVVVGATNRPDLVDPAVLRPGRLERLVYAPPPDAPARAAILRAAAKRSPLAGDVDLDEVARRCEGYSAADCAALVREAALTAMRRSMTSAEITMADVAAALTAVRPSLDPMQVLQLEQFAAAREAAG